MRRLVAGLILAALLAGCFSDGTTPGSVSRPPRAPVPLPPERHHAEQNLSFAPAPQACAPDCVSPTGAPATVAAEIGFAKGLLRYAVTVDWAPADAGTQQLRMVLHDGCGAEDSVFLGASPLRVNAPDARPLCGHVRIDLQQVGTEAGPAVVRNQETLSVHLMVDWENERLMPLRSS